MKVRANEKYYLHWKLNPFTWNKKLEDLLANEKVFKINKRYYTIVIPHYTGNFLIVDCTCDQDTGDYYPIYTGNLKEI